MPPGCSTDHNVQSKGASTLCHAAEYNTLQLSRMAKVARHMSIMRSRPNEKRIFCRPSSGYKNCGTRPGNVVWFFSQTSWYHFETPYSSYAAWLPLMGPTICRPCSIERHAAAEPTQGPHILAAWCDFCCAALPLCAAWHNEDIPQWIVFWAVGGPISASIKSGMCSCNHFGIFSLCERVQNPVEKTTGLRRRIQFPPNVVRHHLAWLGRPHHVFLHWCHKKESGLHQRTKLTTKPLPMRGEGDDPSEPWDFAFESFHW